MDQRTNGVNVIRPGNRPVKKVKKPAASGNTAGKNPAAAGRPVMAPRRKNYKIIAIMTVAVAVTAVLSGGGVYAWLTDQAQKEAENTQKEAYSDKVEFEDRIRKLKDKLGIIESENESLKTANDELTKVAGLVKDAMMEFSSAELGFGFEYPAVFGQVEVKMNEDGGSRSFTGTFTNNDKLIFGGINRDFVRTDDETPVGFLDFFGYGEDKDRLYYRTIGNSEIEEFEIKPFRVVDISGGQVLFVDRKSFLDNRGGEQETVGIGENVGALVSLSGDEFPGVAFMDSDFGQLPLDGFVEMIESVVIY